MCYIQIMGEALDAEKQPVPVVDKQSIKKPLFDRVIHKVFETPERTTEFLSGQIMMGLEIAHDMELYPTKYGMTPNQVGSLPDPNTAPAAAWAVDHIGDIWEISAGFIAMRLGFVAANEALKKIPAAKGYQIPDEACFWASLATTVTVKAIHSMGWISLFHIHDHMGAPVPGMLFGQGVAAVVLAASHYAAKYREPIKDLALRVGGRVVEGAKFVGRKFKEFDEKMDAIGRPDVTPSIAVNTNDQNKE